MARLIALFCASLLVACSAADREPDGTVAQGHVRDMAGILDPATEARLTVRLDEAQARYGPQVGVVTVPSLAGQDIASFTTDYANAWGLGDAKRNDGIIILRAPNDRKIRIGTGTGIERFYPDAWCSEVIEKTMLPQFRQSRFGRGTEAAVDMIVARMKSHPTRPANDNMPEDARKIA